MVRFFLILGILGVWQQSSFAQTTQPADDAAKLYMQAAKLIRDNDALNIMAPASSNSTFPFFPAKHDDWELMEKASFAANAEALVLAHEARPIDRAVWPAFNRQAPVSKISYLNDCRNLANELGDAAVYQHLQGNDAAAIETLRDLWHLAELLQNQPGKTTIRLLVGVGIQAAFCYRFEVIASNVVLTEDTNDTKNLQIKTACELIEPLMKHEDTKAVVNDFAKVEGVAVGSMSKASLTRLIETVNRINAERDMAAMSLACHLYRFDTKEWPKSIDDLRGYLPSLPIDPWGDGTQTLGYALIKAGLPDGSDRPLVYSRSGMKDGLFFRIDQPQYSYYVGDGSNRTARDQKQGGQFRDVASWAPAEGNQIAATTQPLE